MSGQLLSVVQLAKKWGWNKHRLYRLIAAKAIPVLRLPNGYFFREDDVERWLERHAARAEQPETACAPSREAECHALGIEPDHMFS